MVSAGVLKELQFPRANDAIVRAVGLPRITRILDAKFAPDPKVGSQRRVTGVSFISAVSFPGQILKQR